MTGLSDPNSYARTQIHSKTSGSVNGAALRVSNPVYFYYAHGFDTQTLAYVLDFLIRVFRSVADSRHASILAKWRSLTPG